MVFFDKYLKGFFSVYYPVSTSENDIKLVLEISASAFTPSVELDITNNYPFLSLRDQLTFTVTFGDADPISLFSSSLNHATFLQQLSEEYLHQQGEPIKAVITIDKTKVNQTISIYDLEAFTTTLTKLTIAQGFSIFNRAFENIDCVNFEVFGLDKPFHTDTIYFSPVGTPFSPVSSDRDKCIENLHSTCYFASLEQHRLFPNDFKFVLEHPTYKILSNLFAHYTSVLSIVYLFDITTIKDNLLEFKLNGYKSIKGAVDLSTFPIPATDDYYNIYKWAYSSGNLNDKVGLARNIISLHFEKRGEIALKGNPFQSIQSSYKVYEKQNIKQYIEIRNKISDQLLDFNTRANKIIETFASGFQKSALAIITFYTSAIVLRVLSKGDFTNIFTLDATLLSIAFLVSSVVYYFIARWEVKQQRTRFIDSYTNLKQRYTDLLDGEDIKRILNDDIEFKSDEKFITDKLRQYSKLWLSFLIILFLVTIFLFLTYNISQVFETPLWQYFFSKSTPPAP